MLLREWRRQQKMAHLPRRKTWESRHLIKGSEETIGADHPIVTGVGNLITQGS
jgi:hypothetical protein